jgi:hypothetical protein
LEYIGILFGKFIGKFIGKDCIISDRYSGESLIGKDCPMNFPMRIPIKTQ